MLSLTIITVQTQQQSISKHQTAVPFSMIYVNENDPKKIRTYG